MQDCDCKSDVQDGYLRRSLLDVFHFVNVMGLFLDAEVSLFWIQLLLKYSLLNSRVIHANWSLRIFSDSSHT